MRRNGKGRKALFEKKMMGYDFQIGKVFLPSDFMCCKI